MNLNEYQLKAMMTAVFDPAIATEYTALGLAGEAGEVANKVKKLLRDPPKDNAVLYDAYHDIADELGDVLWYIAALAHVLGYQMEDIAGMNLSKLALRQAEGTLKTRGKRV